MQLLAAGEPGFRSASSVRAAAGSGQEEAEQGGYAAGSVRLYQTARDIAGTDWTGRDVTSRHGTAATTAVHPAAAAAWWRHRSILQHRLPVSATDW